MKKKHIAFILMPAAAEVKTWGLQFRGYFFNPAITEFAGLLNLYI